ncbi:ArpU family transcriptional regulator [Enterococcus cecorum]|uniref:ArpU family transcriptional regulator n=1 Tax=Enterococcus cecorum TaxID=44008 RepID=UPI0032C47B85
MSLFDVTRYELPNANDVDLDETKYNIGVFLSAYFAARQRVGQPREPKLTASFSVIPPSTVKQSFEAESILISNEEAQEEFIHLHQLFIRGVAAVQHPFKPDIDKRRKNIFFKRFVNGMTIYECSMSLHISENLVKSESNVIIIQFASALELVAYK